MRQSVSLQFLDMSGSVNTNPRSTAQPLSAVIKPENIALTGIVFSGYGITGVTVQSFSLGIQFSRTSVMQMGSSLPQSRPLTDVMATFQVQGYIEGLNNSMTGLSQYNCGTPTYGTISLVLTPACAVTSPTTIKIGNPYLDSVSMSAQVGNFTTISMGFSIPLGPNPLETFDGSTLTIQ